MESQDRHQQESLKNRITLPVFNNSQPDNVSVIKDNLVFN